MKPATFVSLSASAVFAIALAAPAAAHAESGESPSVAPASETEPVLPVAVSAARSLDLAAAGSEASAARPARAAGHAAHGQAEQRSQQQGRQRSQQQGQQKGQQKGQQGPGQGQMPTGMQGMKPVFDNNWVTLGLGVGMVPSYAGSDDYIAFPLPLIVGRLGGVGLNPNGPGITLNLLSQRTIPGQPGGTTFQLGPAFRIRNDRNARISDEVVEAAGKLDVAAEVGVNAGVSFPRVLNRFDSLTLSTQVRWTFSARTKAC